MAEGDADRTDEPEAEREAAIEERFPSLQGEQDVLAEVLEERLLVRVDVVGVDPTDVERAARPKPLEALIDVGRDANVLSHRPLVDPLA